MIVYKLETKEKLMFIIPIFGWLFIVYGIVVFPVENYYIRIMWYIDIFLSCVVHPVMLFVSIPLGKRAGYSMIKTICLTLTFGGTWWKPLKKNLDAAK